MLNSVEIKHYRSADVESVLLFYANTTYRNISSVDAKDEIVAAYYGNEKIGLYRLCKEENICVLRGFYMLEPYRGNGIGSMMLETLNEVCRGRKEISNSHSNSHGQKYPEGEIFIEIRKLFRHKQ